MMAALIAWACPYLAGAAALLGGAVAVYLKGKAAAKVKATADADRAYIETRKRMDDAVQDDTGVLPDDARQWLRDRAKR